MTQTQTLVRADAQIVTVTRLRAGDVYKRLEADYAKQYSLKVGVVQSVLNNGDDTVITALEFETSYNDAKAVIKVFGTDSDLKLFATTVDEVKVYLGEVEQSVSAALKAKRAEVARLEDVERQLDNTIDASDAGSLTVAVTSISALDE